MTPFLLLLLAVVTDLSLTFILVYLAMRGEMVFRNRVIIIRAIMRYRHANRNLFGRYEVDFTDMMSRRRLYARFWDWGYTNILPPDKFAKIKPYLREKECYGIEP